MEETELIDYNFYPNPLCHGQMRYEASLPSVFDPQRLIYFCTHCEGQAIFNRATLQTTWSKAYAFYTPDPKDSDK